MGDILRFKKPRPKDVHRGRFLCTRGFHQWEAVKEHPFEVRQGRLVTLYRCRRCAATKTERR